MPETVRLLDENGVRIPSPQWDPLIDDLDEAALADLYEDMVVLRRIDAEATALQRQGEIALWPPVYGQEAAQIASGRALRRDDFVFGSYRETGVAYTRGIDPVEIARVWRGAAASAWNPYEFHMATAQVIIGAQTLHATGYALGIQNDGSDQVAVTYFGDGAMSEGDVSEAMIFAATYGAPVVFFCQNNQFAISEPVTLQSKTPLADRPVGFGIPSVQVDGNDVLAVTAVMRQALQRAREGGGPTYIEAVTYRMGPHTTADDPTRYRDPAELELWGKRDPISRLRTLLETSGLDGPELEARAAAAADRVAAAFRAGVQNMPDPEPMSVFDNVYAEPHHELDRQKNEYARYLEGFAS
ncbi:MAG TPA: pyruvate dehydrogenase (acetyl-transferring) E1 component subunit alpha [Pseudolysinimonas sp.]|jgi:pyruvate dehydrogenase E1 component alpha subunit|nr:pyruvate dehydrogenase (acetyl-transferring) E1 component subunit alpha [Pseudolysinimonas sp.]